jgi:nicotinate dehydrogenase subunit B
MKNRSGLVYPSRRTVLLRGSILVSFSLLGEAFAQQSHDGSDASQFMGSLQDNPMLDAWIGVEASGAVAVFTGKAELGQGIRTALLQVAAEELYIRPDAIQLVTADTARTPNEGYTAGSQSMQFSGTAIRLAAAQVRDILVAEAARRFDVSVDRLVVADGFVHAPDGSRLPYGALIGLGMLHIPVAPTTTLKNTSSYSIVGRNLPRVDIPGKVTGFPAYIQDLASPGMLHARVVRPPSYTARLRGGDFGEVRAMSGVVDVIRNGNFLAVAAEGEFQAVKAMRALASIAQWDETPTLPVKADLTKVLLEMPRQDGLVARHGEAVDTSTAAVTATFTRPYQMHGSIGPSCALALAEADHLTVWSHTQGVFPDREAIAEMLGMRPEQVRMIHTAGSGCYGHNGADDAAADAAVIARALPGRPIRVQWMREQEHTWEPYGPAMVTQIHASLDDSGRISDWNYELWSNTHSTRPGPAGALLAARHIDPPFAPEEAKLDINPNGNGDRNAIPLYAIRNLNVIWHFLRDMPVRVSALRSLGAYMNVFSIESMVDELATLAHVDPVEFRLRHLDDARARDVVTRVAEKFGWMSRTSARGRGHGFAFARYKNHASYLAIAVEVAVNLETGRTRLMRAVAAIDSGQAVNPDGIRNQTEGGILQATSWTLYEAVAFNEARIESIDWASYPILRLQGCPTASTCK